MSTSEIKSENDTPMLTCPITKTIKVLGHTMVINNTACFNLKYFVVFSNSVVTEDRLCGLEVRVLGYRSGGPGERTISTERPSLIGEVSGNFCG
jgi:hypothetical protein